MNILRVTTLSLALTVAVFALGSINPAFAGKPVKNCDPDKGDVHPSCKDDGGGGDGGGDIYEVVIRGDDLITGGSEDFFPWSRSGGKNSIGGPAHNSGFLNNLTNFFMALPDGEPFNMAQAVNCFGIIGDFVIRGAGLGTGKKDVAKAQFWFDAKTFKGIPPDESELITLTYQLQYLGTFSGATWFPALNGQISTLNMNEWRLTATNEGEDIKAISCIGEGLTSSPGAVLIAVKNVTGN